MATTFLLILLRFQYPLRQKKRSKNIQAIKK